MQPTAPWGAEKAPGQGPAEGLLIVDDERAWTSMVGLASPLEHQMITTTASEVARIHERLVGREAGSRPQALAAGA